MFPVIDIGPFALQAAGLILLLSLMIGLWLIGKFSMALGTNGEVIENSILTGLISGILGARVGFMLQNPAIFMDNPLSLFSLTPSMLNVNFGLLISGLTIFIIAQKKHLPLWPTLDTVSPLVIFLFAGIHLANLANGDAYGLPTQLPWGIELWNANRHPLQFYALILTIALFIWTFIQTKQFKTTGFMRSGILFIFILAGISFITLFTRGFVAEKTSVMGVDLIQIFAFLTLLMSFALVYMRKYTFQRKIGAFLSLGSNLNPQQNLDKALDKINTVFEVRRLSSTYWTQDVKNEGKSSQFLNQVIEIETHLPFPELVSQLKLIERDFGREPGNKKVVPLDLDVLTYNEDVFTFQGKCIPDPELQKFRYIALPLEEIAPEFRHPADGQSIKAILETIQDDSQVIKNKEVDNGIEE